MTSKQKSALERMHAANAALTPEQRAERSRKAAEASKARAEQKRAVSAAGAVPTKDKATSTTAARVQPEVLRSFDVCLSTDAAGRKWVLVEAGGIKRAMGAARDANPGSKALGAVLAGVLPAGVLGR